MIYADPWNEVSRLEELMDAEVQRAFGRTHRVRSDAQHGATTPRSTPAAAHRHDPTARRHDTLGARYTGRPYRSEHF